MRKDMKKYSSTLGCGMKQAPMVLGLSVALCMPAAFSYASASEGMGTRSIQSVMQGRVVTGQILDELGEPMIGVSVLVKGTTVGTISLILMVIIHWMFLLGRIY